MAFTNTRLRLLFILLILGLGLFSGYEIRQQAKAKNLKTPDYSRLWARVDSCERKGLTEDALKAVNTIYEKAKKENNAAQFVKAVIHQLKFAQYREEFAAEKNIQSLQQEIQGTQFPIKPLLQSLLADAYWQYYQNNRWKFHDRSTTRAFDKKEVSTYSLKDIVTACVQQHKAALIEEKLLKQQKLLVYDEILHKGTLETRLWRPTLYDFLAHRALDFYKNSEADIQQAAHQFEMSQGTFLQTYTEFLKQKIVPAGDSLDFNYMATTLFQKLESFQLESGNREGLLDLELERLQFALDNSRHPKKDSIYLQSLKKLQKDFENSPRVSEIFFLEAEWQISGEEEVETDPEKKDKWKRRKALILCEDIVKKYPGSRGAKQAKNLLAEIRQQSLNLQMEELNVPDKPNRLYVAYRNITKLYFKVVRIDVFEWNKLSNRYYSDKLYSRLLKLPEQTGFEQELPDEKDFNPHSTEIKVPSLPFGNYVLIASTSKQFNTKNQINANQKFVVTNLSFLNRKLKNGSNEFYVLNNQSGQPIQGVNAQLWHYIYDYKTRSFSYQKSNSYISNSNGQFTVTDIELPSKNYFVEMKLGNDLLYTNDNFYNYRQEEYEQPALTSSHIYTDRSIYRPGQTVYFKAIYMNGKNNQYKVVPKHESTLSFYDVNGQLISSQKLLSNEYGSVSGSFTAPNGVLNGQMRISDGISTQYISVEEYKRPKFEAAFDSIKGEYKLKDTVHVTGCAKAYAGNVVDGAKVSYRVLRSVNYPYWWYWYRPYYQSGKAVEILNGTSDTDENGKFRIDFPALPDPNTYPKDQAVFTYEVYADITDINGESHSCNTSLRVGYTSLELSFNIPDVIHNQELPGLQIKAINLNGVEQKVNTSLIVYKLKGPEQIYRRRLWPQPDKHLYTIEEYRKLFPHDQYADELNPYSWSREKQVFSLAIHTGNPENTNWKKFGGLSPGTYVAELSCKDKDGMTVKNLNYFSVYSGDSHELPYKTGQWIHFPKNRMEPGDTIRLITASAYKDVYCLFEYSDQNENTLKPIACSMKALELPVEEKHRGGCILSTRFVKEGRYYTASHYVTVPFSNKELDIEYSTFRNKLLPGQQEEWTLRIRNKKGDKVAAELLASMYDASLDAFLPHNWNLSIYKALYYSNLWNHSLEALSHGRIYNTTRQALEQPELILYDQLNYFGLNFYGSYYSNYAEVSVSSGRTKRTLGKKKQAAMSLESTMSRDDSEASSGRAPESAAAVKMNEILQEAPEKKEISSTPLTPRKNFSETAFFYPHLNTNENGEVLIKFTLPESLTRWKLQTLAHSKEMDYGLSENTCVAQKDMMVVPNLPRFFREGDSIQIQCKLSNLSEKDLFCQSELRLFDAFSDKEIGSVWMDEEFKKQRLVKRGQSEVVTWNLRVPYQQAAVKVRLQAVSGAFSDAEENVIPILSNRMLVTESLPLPLRGKSEKQFSFTKFLNNNSPTLKHHAYTLEFTANPAWYAVQSLPYLMEYPYECAEQNFARYYANALATHIANSKPIIKSVFDRWKTSSPESFLSNLEKNQELKSLLLQETPWLVQAKNESENKRRIALLFDLNKMSYELNGALHKLQQMQSANGGWPWFNGSPDDWYISQHILCGFGKLRKLGVKVPESETKIAVMVENGLRYCDQRLLEHFREMKSFNKKYKSENHLDPMALQYLYMRSHFPESQLPMANREAVNYYLEQCKRYWLQNGRYMQGLIALILERNKEHPAALDILKSLSQNSINNEELGMYWKENYGYYWYNAPIEMQALMIEAYDEIARDQKIVDELKTWLIKSKQTQNWGTTKATTEAIYALLLRGGDWLSAEPNVEIKMGELKFDPKQDAELKAEAGTGYFKKAFYGSDIKTDMGRITVTKKDQGVSWGSVYWQYFEDLDKITAQETPLKLSKKLFVQRNTSSGPVIEPISSDIKLKIGDKITVRLELRSDRDMEYVHLKDMRASGLEPVNVLSAYKYQDGLGYYESTGDAATNFFISWLPKGTYVFEYPLVVSQAGNFSNGISSIQCMYAPEFTSHSEGIRLKISR